MRSNLRRAWPVVVVSLCACSSSAPSEERSETVISAAGGTVVSAGRELTLRVPAGALPAGTTVIVTTHRDEVLSGLVGPVFALETEPTVGAFATAIPIEIVNPQRATEVRINNVDATPVVVDAASYDRATGIAHGRLAHFSRYALLSFADGDDDAGVDAGTPDATETPELDAGASDGTPSPDAAPIEDATPADAGIDADATSEPDAVPNPDAQPIDLGPRAWTVQSAGDTDTDENVAIAIGATGPRILHSLESGALMYTYLSGGTWRSPQIQIDAEPTCNWGCDSYGVIAVDSADLTHIAYRGLPVAPTSDGRSYGSLIRYRTITGSVASAVVNIETIPEPSGRPYLEGSVPAMAVASGVAHIVYRSSAEDIGDLRYASVSGGTASTPISIPNSDSRRTRARNVRVGSIFAGIDASGTLTTFAHPPASGAALAIRRVSGTWQAPLSLPMSEVVASSIDPWGTVHVLGVDSSTTSIVYASISPSGVVSAGPPIPATACGNAQYQPRLTAAHDINGVLTVACYVWESGVPFSIRYFARAGAGWDTPVHIPYPPMQEPEGVTPQLVFDASGRAHIAFQAFGINDLLYAVYQ